MAEFPLGDAVLGTAIDLTGLDEGMKEAEEHARSGFGAIGDIIGGVLKVGLAVAAAGVAAAGAFVASGIADAREAAQVLAQTEAVITSTGGAAQRTAEQVTDLAAKLSAASGESLFGDTQIQDAENLLLTFTNIKGEVFDLATAISVDMAQALGGEPQDQAIALGKALNNPIQGITALTRVGVTFDEQQKRQIETMQRAGDMAGAQKIILAELNKEFGGSARAAAQADGGWAMFQDRMGEAAETIGAAVLPLLNDLAGFLNSRVAPAVESAAQTIAELVPQIAEVAGDAFEWGANLGNQFAAGLASAVATVVSVLQQLGSTIAYWLAPGSPPNLLPEIDVWGQQTAQVWLDGWGAADLSVIEDLGGQVRDVLQGLVKAGDFDEAGVIPAVLGSERAIANAIASADEFGEVSEDAIRGIIDAAGPAGPKVEGLVRAFFDLRKATADVAREQAELNRITQKYADQIDPLSAEIDTINDQQQAIDDQLRIRDLQEDIASGKLDELEQQKALLDIQEIQKRAELRGIERNRDAEVGAAEARLSAAEEAQQAAEDRLRDEQAAVESLNHQNDLIGQQLSLLQQMQREAEAAAKAKAGGGGGGGGAGPISLPTPEPPDISPVTGVLDELETQVADTTNQVETFFAELGATIETAVAPALDVLQPLINIFEDADDPITGLLDVLSEVSPGFELLRGVVEAALPPIQSIVMSVFGIIGGFISEHGATIVTDVTSAWTQIQAIIDGILPPIQSIVETVLGAIATFLAEHGDEIQATLQKAWDTIAIVVNAALALINATVVPAFQYIASFLSAHSDEIEQVLGGAWSIISAVIDTALTLIQGIITTVMQVIEGDWTGAWTTIKDTADQIWKDIQLALEGAWNIISGLVTTAIDGILGPILGMPDEVAGTGAAIVNAIWDGLKAKWDEMVQWFNDKLQDLRDQLPFSEPKDHSSPLYGLSKSGAAIIDNIIDGLEAAAPDLLAAASGIVEDLRARIDDLKDSLEDASDETREDIQKEIKDLEDQIDAIVSAAEKLPELMADAHEEVFNITANVARQQERNLEQLGRMESAHLRENVAAELAAAEAAAALIPDPAKAAEFFRLRSRQIFELAELQDRLGTIEEERQDDRAKAEQDYHDMIAALNKEDADLLARYNQSGDEQERRLILTELESNKIQRSEAKAAFEEQQRQIDALAAAEQERLSQRIALIQQAQAAEQEALKLHQENEQSVFEQMAAEIETLLESIPGSVALPDNWLKAINAFDSMLKEFNKLYGLPPPTAWIPMPTPIGGLADGTDNWGGGWTWVGEEGPELLNLQRGAQVLPTPALGALMEGRMGHSATNTTQIFNIDARGSQMSEQDFERVVRRVTSSDANSGDIRRRSR